jgi:protein-tyrosine phosphatase
MRRLLITVSFLALVTACGQPHAAEPAGEPAAGPVSLVSLAVEEPVRGTYQIRWALDREVPVTIEALSDPSAEAGSGIAVGSGLEGGEVSWSAPAPSQRYYFRVTPEGGPGRTASVRVLPLEGGRNFRDLGGYSAEGGQSVAWGKIYRSGVMSQLTRADYDYLSGLGIQVICDLRTAEERAHEPTDWSGGPAETLTFPDPELSNASLLGAVFQKPDLTPADVREAMTGFYRETLFQQDAGYTAMFDALAEGLAPLAFHCSAGKDRTGVGAALVLAALGVPEPLIIEDYILSDQLVDYRKEMQLDADAGASEEGPYAFLRALPAEIVDPLLKSDAAYIEAALDEARLRHGSVLGFIKAEYDVTDDEIAALRRELLEP